MRHSDLEVAGRLLSILELMLMQGATYPDRTRRRSIEGFVAAHERLWHLRHTRFCCMGPSVACGAELT